MRFTSRSTLFAAFFAIAGTILAFTHRLDGSYVALVAAVQSLVVARSIAEDVAK